MDPEKGLATGEPQQVTYFKDTRVLRPKVLDNGNRIGFSMFKYNTYLQVADSSSPGGARSLVRCGPYSPEISPDGQTVFYINDTPSEEGIYAIPRDGGSPQRLTKSLPFEIRNDAWCRRFDLSPDGRTLAYSTKYAGEHALFTLPASGGEPRFLVQLRHAKKLGTVPQWSPDGSQLAYADGNDLNIIATDGGQLRKLAHMNHGWELYSVRWSPNGKFVAALGMPKPRSKAVFVVPASGGELQQLTSGAGGIVGLEWHPDGQRLTYCVWGYDSETHQTYVDGRKPTLLVNAPDISDYIGAWAPDGHRFFFAGLDSSAKDSGIYVYDEASGKTTLVSGSVGAGLPRWSRDGMTMAWCQLRATNIQTWIMEDFLPESTAGE
jgi:Tol biopolymer transport system component